MHLGMPGASRRQGYSGGRRRCARDPLLVSVFHTVSLKGRSTNIFWKDNVPGDPGGESPARLLKRWKWRA